MPSDAASRRAAALSPIARIASGGGPTQRQPGGDDGLGELRVLGEEPEARVDGVGAGGRRRPRPRPRCRAGRARRARRCPGRPLAMPEARRTVRRIRAAISPRLATNSVRIGGRPRSAIRTAPSMAQTRRTRQTRHANDHRRVEPAATRARSSAGRVRVEVPRRRATSLGLSSSAIVSRVSHTGRPGYDARFGRRGRRVGDGRRASPRWRRAARRPDEPEPERRERARSAGR